MAVIIAKCPVSGLEFETGIETDAASFARMASAIGRARCPYCKTEHEWAMGDAYIRDGGNDEKPRP